MGKLFGKGYGSSSPHDLRAQAFLIFYALIGMPLNGFVLAYLGEFFSKSFIGMYKRYKGQESSYVSQVHNYARMKKFGLITRITMLIIPGIAFFIFLPACLFSYFEDWPYVTSVYYSFITLTTIGFGDYVPTFQNGQERKFGIYFTFYKIFIILWNVIGMGYFVMIIGFIAKGMQSKRIARIEHQLSANIKATQERIWTGVTKDLSFLRRILNEINLVKFTPVYTDSTEKINFNSLPRSLSCPELATFQTDRQRLALQRAYSENCGERFDSSELDTSTWTINRVQSDSDLYRINKKETFKTFEGSNLFQTQDVLSNILTALSSIQAANDDERDDPLDAQLSDEDSCTNRVPRQRAFSDFHIKRKVSFHDEKEWNEADDPYIQQYLRNRPKKFSTASIFASQSESANQLEMHCKRAATLNIPRGENGRSRSFISKINPFKARTLGGLEKRHSVSIVVPDPDVYLKKTAKGRASRISLYQSKTEEMELLETTTIADLIRAVEGAQGISNATPRSPLLTDCRGSIRAKSAKISHDLQAPTCTSRRGSLRTVPAHVKQNLSRSKSSSPPIQPSTPLFTRKTITSPQNSPLSTLQPLQRALRPSPLIIPSHSNVEALEHQGTPIITIQSPDATKESVLWSPELSGVSGPKKITKHKRTVSK